MIKNYFMKKILFVLLIAVSGNFFSQQTIVDEPEFVGECLLIKDNQATLLEKKSNPKPNSSFYRSNFDRNW